VVGLATDQNGLPIVSEVFSGDTTDTLTVAPMLTRLKDLGLTKVVWVTDRGMASAANLSAVRAAGLHYIAGARLRAAEDLRAVIAADNTPYGAGPQGLRLKEVHHDKRRYVVCFLPQSAARDLAMRTAAIARLEPTLTRVNEGSADACSITQHGWYSRLTSRDADGRFSLDKAKLDREAACDGTFVLEVSDETLPSTEVALAYKNLLKVESTFHGLKNTLDIRPVFHRLDRRIRAHVTLCMIALFLDRVIELQAGVPFEQVRKLFARLRAAQLTIEETTTWETTALPPEARKILTALRLDPPPRVLPNS
jgi:transposase